MRGPMPTPTQPKHRTTPATTPPLQTPSRPCTALPLALLFDADLRRSDPTLTRAGVLITLAHLTG
jgi:hypothetical protein